MVIFSDKVIIKSKKSFKMAQPFRNLSFALFLRISSQGISLIYPLQYDSLQYSQT